MKINHGLAKSGVDIIKNLASHLEKILWMAQNIHINNHTVNDFSQQKISTNSIDSNDSSMYIGRILDYLLVI